MKNILLFVLSISTLTHSFAQNKKEMEQKLIVLEDRTKNNESEISVQKSNSQIQDEKIKRLESDIESIKLNLLNTTTTLGLVSKSNTDLEKLVKNQNLLIEKLIKQNDSLLLQSKTKKDIDIITNPSNEEDSIIYLVQSYYACKKWEDRLAYVLKPEIVKKYMSEYYSDGYSSQKISRDKIELLGSGYKNNDAFKVILNGERYIRCKKTSDGFKIDWEANAGYNPIPLNTFKANASSVASEFRVKAELGNYYNYNYNNASSTHWNVEVRDDDSNGIRGCYISKSSAEGQRLYEILKDGKVHELILELKTDTTKDKSGNTAIITKLVNDGWSK